MSGVLDIQGGLLIVYKRKKERNKERKKEGKKERKERKKEKKRKKERKEKKEGKKLSCIPRVDLQRSFTSVHS